MKRWKLVSMAVGSMLVLSSSATAAFAVAVPNPSSTTPNNQINIVNGSGSDTVYFADQALSSLYNASPGCKFDSVSTNTQKCAPTQPTSPAPITTENYDHDLVGQLYPGGSSYGIKQLCGVTPTSQAPVTYARSSRDRQTSDCNNGATANTFRAFAQDGIVPIVFPANNPAEPAPGNFVPNPPAAGCKVNETLTGGCTGLNVTASSGATYTGGFTKKNLVDIYCTGNLNDWGQVVNDTVTDFRSATPAYGTPDGRPIIPWGVQNNSGTLLAFATYLNDPACGTISSSFTFPKPTAAHTVFENNASQITLIADNENACPNPVNSPAVPQCAAAAQEEAQSVYFESFGRVISSPYTTADGVPTQVNAKKAGLSTIASGTFQPTRNLYHVFLSTVDSATLNFLDWECNYTSANHTVDPETGNNYDTEINNTINASGFVRLSPCNDL